MYQDRHNKLLDRLTTAARNRYTVAFQGRPVGDTNLRPDLVLVSGEEAVIIDVTCPFENGAEAFVQARRHKIDKYAPVKNYLARRYQRVTVDAFVIGMLGAWDSDNDALLRRLCSRRYLRTLKRLCVSDAIAASRAIYHAHVSGGRHPGR